MIPEATREADLSDNEDELLNLIDALNQLERKFSLNNRFNLFEAVHMVRQEIRHSRFLAFLLDPHGPHGLGENFLRALLTAAVAEHPSTLVSRLDVAIADLSGASVHCERDHFDVTVQLPRLRLLFVIENKIGAAESLGQLTTYRKRAEARYESHNFLGCFLTPDGYAGEDEYWGTLSYTTIAVELKRVLENSSPPEDVSIAILHYIQDRGFSSAH